MKRILLPLLLALPLCAEVTITRGTDRIDVTIDGKPFTTFYVGGKDVNKPYLHPLRSADGKIVTRHFPMEMVEGESRDHPHHRGLWFSHGEVNGFNFWENESSYTTTNRGKIVLDKIVDTAGGKNKGTIDAVFLWKDPAGKPIMTETRKMVFYSKPDERVIDFDIVLKAIDKVTFSDTKEGTFAIRLADSIAEKKGGGLMTNAEGASGMKNVWGKPSPWVDYVGQVEGEKLGIAILDHPVNPKHPTFWHARDYGLFAANIFGEHDFFDDKARNGSVTIDPGKEMRFRYRVIIHSPGTDLAKAYAAYGK